MEDSLADGRSTEEHLEALVLKYVPLKARFISSVLNGGRSNVETVFTHFPPSPNPTQLAVAIYAVGHSEKERKQLW